jgi:hypothetical protein
MTLSTLRPPALRPGVARWPALSRTVGTAAGSALALALLTCGCVFAALAGPALSLHTRSQALHQTLAQYPNTTKTVQVSASLAEFTGAMQDAQVAQAGRAWTAVRSRGQPATSAAAWRRRRSRSRAASGPV